MTCAFAPTSLAEAIHHLTSDPDLVPLGGCTDQMVGEAEKRVRVDRVLDLLRIRELHGMSIVDGFLQIGATTTFAELRRSAIVRERFPALADAAAVVGGWQIQNRATIGGNIANASPAGDSLPVLLALGAAVTVAGPAGTREIGYDDFHIGYRKTALQRGEIVAWIRLPMPAAGAFQAFRKVGTREAQAISKVVVALAGTLERGRITEARVAAGSVAAMPVRLTRAEDALRGAHIAPVDGSHDPVSVDRVAMAAGRAAAAEATPIDDVRSTASYRKHVLERIVRRMVLQIGQRG